MKPSKNIPASALLARNAARAELLLKQFANRHRLMVLCVLAEGEKTVGEIAKSVDLSQSALSQHLAKLRESGLVAMHKRGQHNVYRIEDMHARALVSMLHVMFCGA